MSATLTETSEVVARLAGEPAAGSPLRGLKIEMPSLLLLVRGIDIGSRVDDDADVASGVGLVRVVAASVTDVLAPPEAATSVDGSIDDSDAVEESIFGEVSVDDGAVPALESAEGADAAEPPVEFAESVDVAPLEESVDDESLGSASAIAGELAIATPSPSVTANAPNRPT